MNKSIGYSKNNLDKQYCKDFWQRCQVNSMGKVFLKITTGQLNIYIVQKFKKKVSWQHQQKLKLEP